MLFDQISLCNTDLSNSIINMVSEPFSEVS